MISSAADAPGRIRAPLAPGTGTDPIVSVAFSPDGQLLATAGNGGLLELREVATGEKVPRPFQIPEKEAAIDRDYAKAEARLNQAQTHREKEEFDDAIAAYTEAIQLYPNNADAFVGRGSAYDRTGEHDKAIADYSEAIRLYPRCALAYIGRGNDYADQKKYDLAIADLTEAIRLLPKDANSCYAYVMRGITYGEKGAKADHEKAVADYTEAIRLAPDNPIGYFQRAKAYRALGDEEQAASNERKYQELTK